MKLWWQSWQNARFMKNSWWKFLISYQKVHEQCLILLCFQGDVVCTYLIYCIQHPEGVLQISSDGDDRMGAKIKTKKKSMDQKLTLKKSHAEFPSLAM